MFNRYKHKKTGNIYSVFTKEQVVNCTNAQNGQDMVMYKSIDDKSLSNIIFVRERNEFLEKFEPWIS